MTSETGEGEGLVFNIQRFSVHDGPGIRTTVFLKGCPLKCLWCSNPESQALAPSLFVRDINCRGCGECARTCPRGAVSIEGGKGRIIDWPKCDQCLTCVDVCIYQSLSRSGQVMAQGEVLHEVLRDELFYRNSGGGVTVSGGEPLSQVEFLIGFLGALKEKGLHAALDTSGYAPEKVFARVVPLVDLVLFDIKHLDDKKHRQYTGVSNQVILANARLAAGKVRTWFRVPLIEYFNDSLDHMARVAEMAGETGVEKISLLPYHAGGLAKSNQIGREYLMTEARAPSDERIQALRQMISGKGIAVTVGS